MDIECCICYSADADNLIKMTCKHVICQVCITKLTKPNCPICSASMLDILSATDALNINNRNIIRQAEIDEEKLETALEQIEYEDDDSDDGDYEEPVIAIIEPLYYRDTVGLADEYLNIELPQELLERLVLEESLGM